MLTFKLEFSNLFRYNQWSPPAQSNETSNGYFLERSHSARLTLEKSIELCPEEEAEGEETVATEESENAVPTVAEEFSSSAKPPGQRTVQARPGHAQPATPRAPPNPSLSMPRSSPSQFSPLHPSRAQQQQSQPQQTQQHTPLSAPTKSDGSNQSGPPPPPLPANH